MPFSTDNTEDILMALNSFGKEFDPQSVPSYNDWLANSSNTFDPFGPEPSGSASNFHARIPLHSKPRYGFHPNQGMRVVDRADQSHGSPKDATRIFPQERSRFAFAQARIERTIDRRQIPIPTQTTSTVARVIGPQPHRFQRGFFAGRKPTLAAPKAVRPLPTWLTHFEDHEDELLAGFRPSEDSTSSLSSTPPMVGLKFPPINVTPLSGFVSSGSSFTFEEVSGWYSDEDGEETEDDYEPLEFDTSDSGSDSVPSWSESSALANHSAGTTAFRWLAPYQGPQVADGEEHPLAGVARPLELLPESSPSLPCQPVLVNPPVDELIAVPPNRPTAASFVASDDVSEVAIDLYLAEVDEELGGGSGSSSGSFLRLLEEGWYNRFDLTGHTFPVLPQGSWNLCMAAGLETPSLVYPATIPLPDIEEPGDAELDAIVISPRSPAFGCWR